MRNAIKYSLVIYAFVSLSVFFYFFHCNQACTEALIGNKNTQTFYNKRFIFHDQGFDEIQQSSVVNTDRLGFYQIHLSTTNGLSGQRYSSRYSLHFWGDELYSIQLKESDIEGKDKSDTSASQAYLEEYFHEEYNQVLYNKDQILCSVSLSTNFLGCTKSMAE
ncbi:hypothetical protein A3K86_19710 [Photobacterium jeanii]|uniref:Uncharacterized protein n=1 Tax=Photobacterium jeanii TaxID=858640 RepID=A0A178K1H8_9GAMM|nr:hypothetical protein [Photobacterium jeanii]OAN11189.1 hypothetical protein A3K86_19710 [Photobacterium jeanii]PST90707.1 hypothetical protein C9I91_08810 [Photobacterium jeanii]